MSKELVWYHLHSDLSLLDSCTDYTLYIDRAKALGHNAISISEHGKPLKWVAKKMYCDEVGIKYMHSVECYLTESLEEKVRDNYHTILIAKNIQGVVELNSLISRSCQEDHFYYVNRITFDEFFKISNNIIKISACLASPLNKLPTDHAAYERLVKAYDYLEIQPHTHPDQIAFNIQLASLAAQYHKPLIAGTDTHSLDAYKAECRKILLISKDKSYGDEDSFDLTCKTYDELVSAFKAQNAIPDNLYLQAIANTQVMADSVEPFALDMALKYPILYGTRERDGEVFHATIARKFTEKVTSGIIPAEQITAYKEAIEEEKRVFHKIEMDGFILSMSELLTWCRENNIPFGPARGSVAGSRVAYVTDIIDVNPEQWHTVFSRFANEDRKEVGDIDIDVIETDRPRIFQYITERFTQAKTARVPSFATIADKGVIDDVGRGLAKIWDADETHGKNDNPYSLKNVAKIKSEFAKNPEATKKKYPEIFYYFDGLVGTRVAQSVHPAGMVISPITLADNYGVFDKEGEQCLWIDMDEVHEIGLVKYDFLVLKQIKIIKDTYSMIGKPYPRTHEINWDDPGVWADMLKSPVGIFQFEGEFAFKLLCDYKPQSIFDMSLVTACIRPSGASYRNDLIARKPHKNPSPIIDKLLEDSWGYLVYQESIIKFLQQICGLSGSEADNIRRAIARKKKEILDRDMPRILDGYCGKSGKPRLEAEEEAKEFLRIIDDASSYMFGYNHSVAYCLIGYICAYLRYYHPYEFITAYLDNAANDEDTTNGTALAALYGLKLAPPRWGMSTATYKYNPEQRVISKGLSSIKHLSASSAIQLFELSQKNKYTRFMDLLKDIDAQTSVDSQELNILINIDYFEEFGNIRELSQIRDMFNFFKQGTAKSIKKQAVEGVLASILPSYATDKNAKGVELKAYTVTDMGGLLSACEDYVRSLHLEDLSLKLKIQNSIDLLGYVDISTGKPEDRCLLLMTDITPMVSKQSGSVWGYRVDTRSLGTGKTARLTIRERVFTSNPLSKGDIVRTTPSDLWRNDQGYWYLLKYSREV